MFVSHQQQNLFNKIRTKEKYHSCTASLCGESIQREALLLKCIPCIVSKCCHTIPTRPFYCPTLSHWNVACRTANAHHVYTFQWKNRMHVDLVWQRLKARRGMCVCREMCEKSVLLFANEWNANVNIHTRRRARIYESKPTTTTIRMAFRRQSYTLTSNVGVRWHAE